MKSFLDTLPQNDGRIVFFWRTENKSRGSVAMSCESIGFAYKEVDGFYVFMPINTGGAWGQFELRLIVEKLEELNHDWQEIINNDKAIKNVNSGQLDRTGADNNPFEEE